MLFGRVIGTVVPCVVHEGLEGVPMLLVQPLDQERAPSGSPIVCSDATRQAGVDLRPVRGAACHRPRD